MKQKISKIIGLILLICLEALTVSFVSYASSDEDGKYQLLIEDKEDLLTDEEEADLEAVMKPITKYGNVAFATGSSKNGEASAKELYREYFGTQSGTIFYIDMQDRKICIFSDGKVYKSISKSRANEITNSVYRYATDEDYFTCAKKAFESIYSVLKGQYILRPMRYAHNLFISIGIASIVMYIVAASNRSKYSMAASGNRELGKKYIAQDSDFEFADLTKTFIKTERQSDSGSSDGGSFDSGSSGGDSGGGGSSGF